jgi:hypothetical protein
MTRSALAYDTRAALATGGFDPDVPTAGFYRVRLRKGAIPSGLHIYYGQGLDPETGEPIERWAWQARVNGEPADLRDFWPGCARDPIGEAEYRHLCSTQEWGRQNDPDGAYANRNKPVDMLSAVLPF